MADANAAPGNVTAKKQETRVVNAGAWKTLLDNCY